MMLGADVTHSTGMGTPKAGEEDVAPSIAAVVSTIDGSGDKYSAQVREQTGRQEIIQGMQEMTSIHLKEWIKQMKGQKPQQIIVCRDGVSEGQLAAVVQSEVLAIKGESLTYLSQVRFHTLTLLYSSLIAACRELDPKYNPKMLYIVCAKR